ncbi:transposase [Leptospira kirschneri serovar Mozdok]|nr:transposase [Leptospira kirschneri serovar Mozdok]
MHLIINDQGEILSFMESLGDVDNRNSKVIFPLVKNIYGKLFGDRDTSVNLYLKVFMKREFKSLQN